jgi:hypothetical protein
MDSGDLGRLIAEQRSIAPILYWLGVLRLYGVKLLLPGQYGLILAFQSTNPCTVSLIVSNDNPQHLF